MSTATDKDKEVAARVEDALRLVIDPELGYNIVDLGLVYDIIIKDGNNAHIMLTTTTRGCPATGYLQSGSFDAASSVDDITFAEVELTYEPPWTPKMMSPEAKAHFGIVDEPE
jgi:metal-sulfur cluster biosynthetic enzyme